MDLGLRNARNRATGASFEAALSWEAARADILAVRNGQTVRWTRGGKTVAVKSNLDWTLVRKGAPVAVVDCKSFAGRRFGLSVLDPHQLALARRYTEHGAVAGFVVLLREVNVVAFYPAQMLGQAHVHARMGFGVDDGIVLGRLQHFDLTRVWGQPG